MKKIEIHPRATLDIERGAEFYELQEAGAGRYFTDCILTDIDSLQIYAGVHETFLELHRCVSKRFPFTIHYRVIQDLVTIVAIYDWRRNPAEIESDLHGRIELPPQ